MASDKYDVIVIGAGLGGLTCATHLVKKGLKVLLLEKNNNVGGCACSFKRKNFVFDGGAHIFGSCGKYELFGLLLKNLGIKVDFIKLSPAERITFPGSQFEIPADFDAFRQKLIVNFKEDEKAINEFFELIKKIWRRFVSVDFNDTLIKKLSKKTFKELSDETFKSEKLKAIIATQFLYAGIDYDKISASAMLLILGSYLKDGCYYPAGGVGEVAQKIADEFIKCGGVLNLSEEVTRIEASPSQIKQVFTNKNRVFKADFFVSNIDLRKTFFELIDKNLVDGNYLRRLESLSISNSFFILYLGISDEIKDLDRLHSFYCSREDFSSDFEIFLIFKPPRKNTLHIVYPVKENIVWDKDKKTHLEGIVLEKLNKIYPGIIDKIIVKESATPKTLERYTGNSFGSCYGWTNICGQIFDQRPEQQTPFSNLILSGHWSQPGSGMLAVTLSGISGAGLILERLKQNE